MSQKKVDIYKEQKANRAQIIKKEKRILFLEKMAALVLCAVVVCWIGFSIYSEAVKTSEENVTVVDTEINMSALDDFINGLDAETE